MQDTAPCAPQRSPLCLPMPALPRRHPMLPGLLVLLLSVTHVMGADEEESRSPLVRAMAASEKEQVRMLLPEAERGTQAQGPNLCFDAAETVCFCRVPRAIALQVCGGPCWAVDAGSFGGGAATLGGVPTPLQVAGYDASGKFRHLPAYEAAVGGLWHGTHYFWACARGHTGVCALTDWRAATAGCDGDGRSGYGATGLCGCGLYSAGARTPSSRRLLYGKLGVVAAVSDEYKGFNVPKISEGVFAALRDG
jgi:hypothetical protein